LEKYILASTIGLRISRVDFEPEGHIFLKLYMSLQYLTLHGSCFLLGKMLPSLKQTAINKYTSILHVTCV